MDVFSWKVPTSTSCPLIVHFFWSAQFLIYTLQRQYCFRGNSKYTTTWSNFVGSFSSVFNTQQVSHTQRPFHLRLDWPVFLQMPSSRPQLSVSLFLPINQKLLFYCFHMWESSLGYQSRFQFASLLPFLVPQSSITCGVWTQLSVLGMAAKTSQQSNPELTVKGKEV